ncbi:DNA mismatch repair endonuclease MutL [Salinarchaeum sp. IM2453]|uniref:DNA mismatch repair endonuclease MutL n=1 Tax=Salinarchaeum sp. IM2453 TaxID=2862870 RepID=UPI001C83D9CB|nr:DNA mismatch repair endonuclease MutL [Salinarchaeum sp. IM2453]QZA89553.1 DNA mismatch repair endonuclease MutL [Salinarchaeum sp. IM2453]
MSSPDEIHQLDQQTVAQIAAGEVVERPASVVKELIENSLDAGATQIDVEVDNGGIDRIAVRDDGHGMTQSAAKVAVKEHTTSKIKSADEIDSVDTLGFRGEALHTIGAVSRMEITTKAKGETGTRIQYTGGEINTVEPAGRPVGTTVEVSDLFYNTPARRKYLSKERTEFSHISRVTGRYALANPDVAISLSHDGSDVFATSGQGDHKSAIMSVYGREVAESMIEVGADPSGSINHINGFVSDPETTRSTRDYLATYINDRYVESDTLQSAIVDAYNGQLAASRYPFAILFVDLPSNEVDINVHPRKLAVRYEHESEVRDTVKRVVRDALLSEGHIRTSAPRGTSAPDETSIATDNPDLTSSANITESNISPEETKGVSDLSSPESRVHQQTSTEDPKQSSSHSVNIEASSSECEDNNQDTPTTSPEPSDSSHSSDKEPSQGSDSLSDTDSSGSSSRFDLTTQQALTGDDVTDSTFSRLPSLSVLGQFDDSYIVCEDQEGLILIDQHAADERIHYERLREATKDETVTQSLATPVELTLTPDEAAIFDAVSSALAQLGFHTEQDGTTIQVRSVPAIQDHTLSPDVIRELFDAILDDAVDESATLQAMVDEILADMACSPAITANTSLHDGSVRSLLSELDRCENPYECPHGRPTLIRVPTKEIEDRFERDYPGHSSRSE